MAAALEPFRHVLLAARGRSDRELSPSRPRPGQGHLGADLARTEKFTTSVRDGIDIRETLRNWHTGDLYVKVVPPSRGSIEAVVFFFDVPADPEVYVHRTTWYAEHAEESTLAFYATDPMKNLVGTGDRQGRVRRRAFPVSPASDPGRLVRQTAQLRRHPGGSPAGARLACTARTVTSPSSAPTSRRPAGGRLARKFGRKIVHLPLKRFSGQLLERLRTFHVLNGKHVRSYAADFIRDM